MAALFVQPPFASAQPRPKARPPKVAPASPDGRLSMSRFKLPAGTRVELVAAEPMLANPVTFCIDAQGRFYIGETFRQQKGVEDNRYHMNWLHDDLAAQTVDDRLKMFKKYLGEKISDYALEEDRIRLLEDTNGDGKIDKASVFADGFNGILEGTGAGLLARRGKVYYTCIPKLWLLEDKNGDGRADERKPLHHGYGVRVAFRGHDMHGLCMGPDGRLYFSIGDRGYNVKTAEGKQLTRPDTGAVFRCEPDGSHLEVFAYGLRNPQELAFDDYGNLFTGDNNSDSGDKTRWVYVVEGGDTGWRMYYQYLQDRGPWNRERIWYPYRSDKATTDVQPAFIVPPVAHIGNGPSGLTYYPGVGLPEKYRGHFFLADFRGNAANSLVHAFTVKTRGAGFEMVGRHDYIKGMLATDVDFGYDGNLYATDWVSGWDGPGKGRLYRFVNDAGAKVAAQSNSAKLMRAGFDHRSEEELLKLLSHADRRIRQEAQFALADKDAIPALTNVAASGENQLARIHAIWALGQIHRRKKSVTLPLRALLEDPDAEIRAQTMKWLGDAQQLEGVQDVGVRRYTSTFLLRGLQDDNPRVQFFAAIGLGKAGLAESLDPLLAMLDENNNNDPWLRHAGVMGLTGIGSRDAASLLAKGKHPKSPARLGVLLALRRLHRPEIAQFLADTDRSLILEAARAINDEPIEEATASLAELADQPNLSPALLRRVLNANFRLGKVENAAVVTRFAADASVSEPIRLEALTELRDWANPPPLDRVTGRWRPLFRRSADQLANVIRPALGGILNGPDSVRQAGAGIAASYGIKEVGPALFSLVTDEKRPDDVRIEALRALESLKDARLSQTMKLALSDKRPLLRAEGRRLLARLHPEKAVLSLASALKSGETVEKQSAVRLLATLKITAADAILDNSLDDLLTGKVLPEIQLDLIEATRKRGTPSFKAKLAKFEASRPKNDPLAAYRESLAGGNVRRGRDIFFGRSSASCRRCHKVDGSGADVGPDLSSIGLEKKRDYLLESMVVPNKQIAKGFETIVLAMDDGRIHTGIIKADDGNYLHVMTPDGQVTVVPKSEVEGQSKGQSGMPADLIKNLSKSDLRDLVEFLASLKKPRKKNPKAKPASAKTKPATTAKRK